MEYSELIREIISRVSAYMEADSCYKKKLIILTQNHETMCHKFLECPELKAQYCTECALMNEYCCDISECAGVVLFDLTNEALVRITSGLCDTPYSRKVMEALLLGKPVWVAKEEIELCKYEASSPYARMMYEKLRLLESYGVTVCSYDSLTETILYDGNEKSLCNENASKTCCEERVLKQALKDYICAKKVITEKDVVTARAEGASRILAGEKAIVTDLAKEFARSNDIEIVKG